MKTIYFTEIYISIRFFILIIFYFQLQFHHDGKIIAVAIIINSLINEES